MLCSFDKIHHFSDVKCVDDLDHGSDEYLFGINNRKAWKMAEERLLRHQNDSISQIVGELVESIKGGRSPILFGLCSQIKLVVIHNGMVFPIVLPFNWYVMYDRNTVLEEGEIVSIASRLRDARKDRLLDMNGHVLPESKERMEAWEAEYLKDARSAYFISSQKRLLDKFPNGIASCEWCNKD